MVTIPIAFSLIVLHIYIEGLLLNMNRGEQQIPDFVGLGSRFGFNVPILGMFLRLWGCSTVHKQSLKSLMKRGKTIGLVPGGYEEATLTTPREMRFYLKNRKGFVKYALRYGYTMRPVVCIGENKAFETVDSFKSLRLFLNKFKMPASFFINWKYLFFVDPNLEITTIVGKGIKKENADPNYEPTVE